MSKPRKRVAPGQKNGRLTTVEYSHTAANGSRYWKYLCDCGNECVKAACDVRRGRTKSCGCAPKHDHPAKLPGNEAAKRRTLQRYKWGAKDRNHSFCLSDEDALSLMESDCHYCGGAPSNINKGRCTDKHFVYNGIDRKDNDMGYTKDNVVSCCKNCNRAKRTMGYDEFLTMCNAIAARHPQP